MERRRRRLPSSLTAPPPAGRAAAHRASIEQDDESAFAAVDAELSGPYGDAERRSRIRPTGDGPRPADYELRPPLIDGLASRRF